jgi:hypothetical protein
LPRSDSFHGATLKELAYRKPKPDEDTESANPFNQVPLLKSLNPAFKDVQTMGGTDRRGVGGGGVGEGWRECWK